MQCKPSITICRQPSNDQPSVASPHTLLMQLFPHKQFLNSPKKLQRKKTTLLDLLSLHTQTLQPFSFCNYITIYYIPFFSPLNKNQQKEFYQLSLFPDLLCHFIYFYLLYFYI